jgi:hypothetical protein
MAWLCKLYAGTAVVWLVGCSATPEDNACDRSCLIDVARAALTGERPLPKALRFTENGTDMPPAASFLQRATQLDIHGEYADANAGAVVLVGTGQDDDARPSVFGLRLQLKGEEPTEAELIITHEGEVSLFPPAVPLPKQSMFTDSVSADQRTPGKRMIEIANAYFDGIEVDSGADVPVTDDCNRVENGVQTTNSERFSNLKCNSLEVFDYIPEVRERRFPLVDEERGVVAGLVAFYIPGGDYERIMDGMKSTRHYDPRSLFLMEAFKIEDGKIRQINATMRNMPLGSSMGWPGPAANK